MNVGRSCLVRRKNERDFLVKRFFFHHIFRSYSYHKNTHQMKRTLTEISNHQKILLLERYPKIRPFKCLRTSYTHIVLDVCKNGIQTLIRTEGAKTTQPYQRERSSSDVFSLKSSISSTIIFSPFSIHSSDREKTNTQIFHTVCVHHSLSLSLQSSTQRKKNPNGRVSRPSIKIVKRTMIIGKDERIGVPYKRKS